MLAMFSLICFSDSKMESERLFMALKNCMTIDVLSRPAGGSN